MESLRELVQLEEAQVLTRELEVHWAWLSALKYEHAHTMSPANRNTLETQSQDEADRYIHVILKLVNATRPDIDTAWSKAACA